jgi:hypothetical protein
VISPWPQAALIEATSHLAFGRVALATPEPRLAKVDDFATSALEAANLDLPVFPLQADTKRPAIKNWPARATTDPDTILKWAEQFPRANVGAAMRDTLALDVDGPKGEQTLERLELDLPPTLENGARRGPHLLYQATLPFRPPKELGPGLDVKGNHSGRATGYLVLPTSTVNGHTYRWRNDLPAAPAPAELVKLLRAVQLKRREGRDFALAQPIYEHQRNTELTRLAGRLFRDGFTVASVMEPALQAANAALCRPPLAKKEVSRIAQSAVKTFKAPPPWFGTPLQVQRWCAQGDHSPTAVAVLRCLTDYANEDGEARPSLPTIREATRRGSNRVYDALRELEEAGRLEARRIGRGSQTVYVLNPGTSGCSCTTAVQVHA